MKLASMLEQAMNEIAISRAGADDELANAEVEAGLQDALSDHVIELRD